MLLGSTGRGTSGGGCMIGRGGESEWAEVRGLIYAEGSVEGGVMLMEGAARAAAGADDDEDDDGSAYWEPLVIPQNQLVLFLCAAGFLSGESGSRSSSLLDGFGVGGMDRCWASQPPC